MHPLPVPTNAPLGSGRVGNLSSAPAPVPARNVDLPYAPTLLLVPEFAGSTRNPADKPAAVELTPVAADAFRTTTAPSRTNAR